MSVAVQIGVVGLGFMGRTHVSAFQRAEGCELVAVADRDSSRLTGESVTGGNFDTGGEAALFDPAEVSTCEDAMELIEHPDVELVSVTTPTHTHRALARTVIAFGRTIDWYLSEESWWRSVMDGSYRDWIDTNYEGRS